jgi:hypothetical protein
MARAVAEMPESPLIDDGPPVGQIAGDCRLVGLEPRLSSYAFGQATHARRGPRLAGKSGMAGG